MEVAPFSASPNLGTFDAILSSMCTSFSLPIPGHFRRQSGQCGPGHSQAVRGIRTPASARLTGEGRLTEQKVQLVIAI